jgi:hypothetical protein
MATTMQQQQQQQQSKTINIKRCCMSKNWMVVDWFHGIDENKLSNKGGDAFKISVGSNLSS